MQKFLKTILWVIILFIGLQLMNQFLIFSGNNIYRLLQFQHNFKISLIGIYQQLIQFFLAVIFFYLLVDKKIKTIGLNFNDWKKSLKYFGYFAITILGVILLYLQVSKTCFPLIWQEMQNTPLPQQNEMVVKLLVQSIFPGLGEETLFRGFLISFLIKSLDLDMTNWKSKLVVSMLSGFFFAVAHIYFQLSPLKITHIDFTQLILAFSCGIAYSLMFIKTKSLVGPILSHNFSNVSMSIAGYIVSAL